MRPLLLSVCGVAACSIVVAVPSAHANNQTPDVTPVTVGAAPYQIGLCSYDMDQAVVPTLHSFAAGQYDDKWVVIAGRSNGLHGFDIIGSDNFPVASQNREVWVIDPISKQIWSRSLADASSGLTADQLATLTPANNQFTQIGDRLYMTGGYGATATATGGRDTFSALSAIDLPGLISAVWCEWVNQARCFRLILGD